MTVEELTRDLHRLMQRDPKTRTMHVRDIDDNEIQRIETSENYEATETFRYIVLSPDEP